MEARRRTWFDERGLVVARRAASGRCRSTPARCTTGASTRALGARACARCTRSGSRSSRRYVPWRVHEPTAGTHDWSGATDLARSSTAARAAGLAVVLRPGPHVNAELTELRVPRSRARRSRVPGAHRARHAGVAARRRRARCRSRRTRARRFTRASALVRRGRARRRAAPRARWSGRRDRRRQRGAAVLPHRRLRSRLPPRRARLVARGLRASTVHRRARGIPPTRRAASRGCGSRTQYLARALGEFAQLLDDVGLGGIARFHNLPPATRLYDLRGIQHAIGGPVGIDAYTPRADCSASCAAARSRASANADAAPARARGRHRLLPVVPAARRRRDDPTRERDHLLTLLAGGHARLQPVHGRRARPLLRRRDHRRTASSSRTRRGSRRCSPTLAELDWPSLRRATADRARRHARRRPLRPSRTAVLDPMTPVLAEVARPRPGRRRRARHRRCRGDRRAALARPRSARALELAQVPYAIVDEAAHRGRARALIAR